MKLKFDPNLEYQQDAISAVVDVFDGQAIESSDLGFEIDNAKKDELDLTDMGVGNQLEISDENILEIYPPSQKTMAHFWAVDECLFLLRWISTPPKEEKIPRHAKRGVELHTGMYHLTILSMAPVIWVS